MYLKVVFKRNDKGGHRVMEYRMVESYRSGDRVKQQNILHLGALLELPTAEQKRELGKRIDELIKEKITGQQRFSFSSDEKIEELAQKYCCEIIEKKRIDVEQLKNYELVDTDNITNHDAVEAGAEWLCYQALEQLDFNKILENCNFNKEEIKLAYTHLISRAVHPASELATSKWIKENSGVCEITNYSKDNITKDKLYGISKKLYEYKTTIEKSLSKKTNELFDVNDNVIIYDLTNTYFEGKLDKSELAKYGRSKEKRSDAKLIVLALVINEHGFLKYSKIFEGNKSDTKTLIEIIEDLTFNTSEVERKPVIVMDAGISSESNLNLLKEKGFDYMCVSRSGMSTYEIDNNAQQVKLNDNKGQVLTLQRVTVPKKADEFIRVHSEAKELKEKSMNTQFKQRFEKGIAEFNLSLTKKRGVKTLAKVAERIGKLRQKYPSIYRYYDIDIEEENGIVSNIKLTEKESKPVEGHYLLRTTLNEKDEATKWKIYNVIREVEATFKILKTDLDLRPVYHKTDSACEAHLHLGILAYSIVNTIRYQLKKVNDNRSWKAIVAQMNTHKIITTKLPCADGKIIYIRKFSEPSLNVKATYDILNYKQRQFTQKKVVVTPQQSDKNDLAENQHFRSG